MSAAITSCHAKPPASERGRLLGFPPSILRVWAKRRRVRHELATLHDDQIREAGLDRCAVRAEAAKPFWRS